MDLKITVDNIDIYDSDSVYAELYRYWSYTFVDVIQPTAGHATVYNDFAAAWALFIEQHGEDLLKAVQAVNATYNPLSNYDMIEKGANGERRGNITSTTTPSGKTTQTSTQSGSVTDTTTMYESGLDSTGDGVQVSKTSNTRTPTTYRTTNETTYGTGTKTDVSTVHTNDQSASAGSESITGANVASEHVLTRSGNIGVTTSQQMLQAELDLRANVNLLENFVKRFINKYCILVGVD